MELSQKQKEAFLKDFGHGVEALIYKKFKSKEQFLAETGFYKKSLHDILTGGRDTHLSTILKLALALEVLPGDLFPKK